MADNNNILVQVDDLKVHFFTNEGTVRAVDGVTFNIHSGQTLCMVGESGCGKSVTARALLQIVHRPGKIVDGDIILHRKTSKDQIEQVHISDMEPKGRAIRSIRGKEISMIFQEPMTSLSPMYTVGNQIMESILLHSDCNRKQAKERAIEMLRLVGIPLPEKRFGEYPHQLSGGMRQRVMIAIALSCNPQLLICDEPTTALDVTIQAQILELINDLKQQTGASVIMITHDLGVISRVADEVMVMYAGKAMEYGAARDVFTQPRHPYTAALLKSIPNLEEDVERLHVIEGMVPSLSKRPQGCLFHPRCKQAMTVCQEKRPALTTAPDGRRVRCFLHSDAVEKEAAHG